MTQRCYAIRGAYASGDGKPHSHGCNAKSYNSGEQNTTTQHDMKIRTCLARAISMGACWDLQL